MNTIAGLNVETVVAAYIEAALWTSMDDDDKSLDNYDASEAMQKSCHETVVKFLTENSAVIETAECFKHDKSRQLGHDLWMAQNHHGCGFWEESDWTVNGDALTTTARALGECYLYVNDQGMVDCG